MKLKLTLFLIFVWGINLANGQTSGEGVDYLYAKRLYNDSMFDLAAKQFHEFAEKYPESPQALEALLWAGDSYFKLNKFEDARREYIYLILKFPKAKNADQAQFNIGKCFREQDYYIEAAKAFQQVKVLYPESKLAEKAFLETARMFVLGKQYDSAIEIFFDFLEEFSKSPHFLEAQLELAKTFKEKGESKRALIEINKVLETTKKGKNRAQALLLQAEIEENLGKSEKAKEIYLSVVSEYSTNNNRYQNILVQAYLKLATMYRKNGQYTESNKYLSNPQLTNINQNSLSTVKVMMADNYFDLGEFSEAIKLYQDTEGDADTLNFKLTYKIGLTYEKLNEFQNAIECFKKILNEYDQSKHELYKGYCECSYLAISRNYSQLKHAQIALRYLKNYTMTFPNSNFLDHIEFKIANIYRTELLEYERALRLYYDFIETYPQSLLVDDARLSIAHCYESLRNYDQALKEYQKYLNFYPGAEQYNEVEKRIDYLNKFWVKTETGALTRFASLIGDVINKPQQDDLTFKLALTYVNELKDYSTAIPLLQNCYAASSYSSQKDEVLFYLAKSYQNLAEKEFYEHGIISAYLDSAQSNYLRLVKKFPQSEWCDDASMALIETKLLQTDSLRTRNKILEESLSAFIINYPTSLYLDYAYFHLGNAYLNDGIKNSIDSSNASTQFQKLLTEYPNSRYAGKALFKQCMVILSSRDKLSAQNKLTQYIQQFPQDKDVVQAHYILAKLYAEMKEYEKALFHFKKIINSYFYSHYADSANIQIGNIYMETKNYSEGINHFLQLKQDNDTPCHWNSYDNTNNEHEIIFRLGKFYQKLDEKQLAISYYHNYLKRFPAATHVPDVLFFLAELFHTNIAADYEMALSYFKRLLNDFPESPWNYKANIHSGDILLRKNEYLEARKHYLNAANWTAKVEEKLYPTMQAIICLHKEGQIAKGDAEAEKFKKTYKDVDEYLGQIELAKGDHYFERKFFETAEKIYKSAKSRFKKTEYGPKAELALGKLYLTLNKDEDALKILTAMPKKYAKDDIIPEVYLILGEFYYIKTRQPEHAMIAFKNAIDHPTIEEQSLAKGMSYLIKCYFDLRLWEQALTLSRNYLERFPLAKNAFDVRIQVGYIYHQLNEYDRAINYLKALKREADSESEPHIQFRIAESYWEKGQFEKAITEYLKVKYISKPTKLDWAVTALYKAGLAYMKLGKMSEAKMIFKKIVIERGAESNFGRGAQKKIDEIEQLND